MRKLVALSFIVVLACAAPLTVRADDAAEIAAVNASSNALDEAFTKKDVGTIKALMTPDHITVTPFTTVLRPWKTSSIRSASTIGARRSSAT